uniref:Uncharacterized protein n=1 Tax=Amphimedon queenslandica TaxID=400682 RepID=A0A1X7UAM6_AMPQE
YLEILCHPNLQIMEHYITLEITITLYRCSKKRNRKTEGKKKRGSLMDMQQRSCIPI